ncbi:MAG: hypothetical protein MZW92_11215 [Comamonadaceae bacterium]|nr:hypothetical protein [Comamonadaceae bacterium]
MRKAVSLLRKLKPDVVVADFYYPDGFPRPPEQPGVSPGRDRVRFPGREFWCCTIPRTAPRSTASASACASTRC